KRFGEEARLILQERVEDFVEGREGFSEIWKECGENVPSRKTLERAQASLKEGVHEILKGSFEGETLVREIKTLATKLERRHRSIAWKYYEGRFEKPVQSEIAKNKEALEGEVFQERVFAYYKSKTNETIQKTLGEVPADAVQKEGLRGVLLEIAGSQQEIFKETLSRLNGDLTQKEK